MRRSAPATSAASPPRVQCGLQAKAYVSGAGQEGGGAGAQRADLAVTWLCADPHRQAGHVLTRRYCRRCQPRGAVVDVACVACGDGAHPHRRPRNRDHRC